MNLTLRIKDEDFSPFAGFGSNFNQELNFYLNMFESNDNFTCLKIESKTGNLDLAKISFIQYYLSYKKIVLLCSQMLILISVVDQKDII